MKVEKIVKGQYITESNKKSLEDCQKWVDYDLKRYGKISDTTMKFIVEAGFTVGRNEDGELEVIKFTKTENKNLKEDFDNDGKVVVVVEDDLSNAGHFIQGIAYLYNGNLKDIYTFAKEVLDGETPEKYNAKVIKDFYKIGAEHKDYDYIIDENSKIINIYNIVNGRKTLVDKVNYDYLIGETEVYNENLQEAFENTSPDDMNYKMDIVIFNPENTSTEKTFQLDAKFSYNKDTYGNGYYVFIKGENGFDTVYDLRYDIDFNPKDKMKWLIDWANHYWSGRNGAYKLKKISIEKDITENLFKRTIKEAYFNRGAHKIIVDKYWARDNIDVEDFVYVILPRQKVFSRITRQDLFDNKLYYGTFIDNIPLDGAQKEVDDYAKEIINELGAKEVSIEELKNIENETKDQDVAQAFAHAEKSFNEAIRDASPNLGYHFVDEEDEKDYWEFVKQHLEEIPKYSDDQLVDTYEEYFDSAEEYGDSKEDVNFAKALKKELIKRGLMLARDEFPTSYYSDKELLSKYNKAKSNHDSTNYQLLKFLKAELIKRAKIRPRNSYKFNKDNIVDFLKKSYNDLLYSDNDSIGYNLGLESGLKLEVDSFVTEDGWDNPAVKNEISVMLVDAEDVPCEGVEEINITENSDLQQIATDLMKQAEEINNKYVEDSLNY